MIHKTNFPENSYDAPEMVKKQLQQIPGKSYQEQDTLFHILSWQWHFIIKGITPEVEASIQTITTKPHEWEALYLWTKQDSEHESVFWEIYVHKKTGKYYKFLHTH